MAKTNERLSANPCGRKINSGRRSAKENIYAGMKVTIEKIANMIPHPPGSFEEKQLTRESVKPK